MIAYAAAADSIPDEPQLTLRQAASRLGVHYQTAMRLVNDGQLRAVKVGKRWGTYASWINEYLLSQQNAGQQNAGLQDTTTIGPLAAEPVDPEVDRRLAGHGVSFA